MKKFMGLFLSLFLLCLILVGCSKNNVSNVATSDNKSEEIKKFVVGFDAEYPPYGYLSEDGKSYEGFDLDIAKEFCKRAGYEFVPQPIDWDSKDLELNSGNIDCIWNGFTMTGRENNYTWSFPYVDNSIVFIVKNDSDIVSKKDLANKTVITQAGSSALAALTNEDEPENIKLAATFKSLEQCADFNTAFMNLETGLVDAIVVDIGVAKYQLKNNPGKYRELDEKLSLEQYAIGFKLGNESLRDEVEKVITEMWKDGTFMNIANKYTDFSLPDSVCLGNYIK